MLDLFLKWLNATDVFAVVSADNKPSATYRFSHISALVLSSTKAPSRRKGASMFVSPSLAWVGTVIAMAG